MERLSAAVTPLRDRFAFNTGTKNTVVKKTDKDAHDIKSKISDVRLKSFLEQSYAATLPIDIKELELEPAKNPFHTTFEGFTLESLKPKTIFETLNMVFAPLKDISIILLAVALNREDEISGDPDPTFFDSITIDISGMNQTQPLLVEHSEFENVGGEGYPPEKVLAAFGTALIIISVLLDAAKSFKTTSTVNKSVNEDKQKLDIIMSNGRIDSNALKTSTDSRPEFIQTLSRFNEANLLGMSNSDVLKIGLAGSFLMGISATVESGDFLTGMGVGYGLARGIQIQTSKDNDSAVKNQKQFDKKTESFLVGHQAYLKSSTAALSRMSELGSRDVVSNKDTLEALAETLPKNSLMEAAYRNFFKMGTDVVEMLGTTILKGVAYDLLNESDLGSKNLIIAAEWLSTVEPIFHGISTYIETTSFAKNQVAESAHHYNKRLSVESNDHDHSYSPATKTELEGIELNFNVKGKFKPTNWKEVFSIAAPVIVSLTMLCAITDLLLSPKKELSGVLTLMVINKVAQMSLKVTTDAHKHKNHLSNSQIKDNTAKIGQLKPDARVEVLAEDEEQGGSSSLMMRRGSNDSYEEGESVKGRSGSERSDNEEDDLA
ncbi:hypothetical protein HOG98_06165 [bacterium]|nr:hypothetical protein [bacterium]